MAYDRDADRLAILEATLPHVPFDGWSERAMEAGANDAGVPIERMLNAFPGGMTELMDFFHKTADSKMLASLANTNLSKMRIRDQIALAVRTRLEQNIGNREAIRAACTFLAMPQNFPTGAKCLYRTVDAIWYAAGDRSTDYNFYTKRGLLAGVYGATVLYWLNDKSPGQEQTWAFLDRRIGEVLALPRTLAGIGRAVDRLPNPLRVLRRIRGAHRVDPNRPRSAARS